MRPAAAATAIAVATATKSISRTESLELVRCLLRVVSLFWGGWGKQRKRNEPNASESVFFSSSFFPLPPVASPRLGASFNH